VADAVDVLEDVAPRTGKAGGLIPAFPSRGLADTSGDVEDGGDGVLGHVGVGGVKARMAAEEEVGRG
jgi:hypothetical protein